MLLRAPSSLAFPCAAAVCILLHALHGGTLGLGQSMQTSNLESVLLESIGAGCDPLSIRSR